MKHYAIGTLLTITLSTSVLAGDIKNGEILFNKAHCQSCHTTEAFTQPKRKVNSLESLESKVRFCDSQLSANWFDDEITDVVSYLNKAYYKFPETETSDKKD